MSKKTIAAATADLAQASVAFLDRNRPEFETIDNGEFIRYDVVSLLKKLEATLQLLGKPVADEVEVEVVEERPEELMA